MSIFIFISISISISCFVFIFISLSIYLPIHLSIYLSVYLSIYRSIDLSIYLSVSHNLVESSQNQMLSMLIEPNWHRVSKPSHFFSLDACLGTIAVSSSLTIPRSGTIISSVANMFMIHDGKNECNPTLPNVCGMKAAHHLQRATKAFHISKHILR